MGSSGFALADGEGKSVWTLGGEFTLKLSGEDNQNRLSILEVKASRASEPPLHIHTREDEAWYVLEGAMTFHVGDSVFTATKGSFAYAPMGIPHAFTVDVEPTRVLLLASPAGFEGFALELGVPVSGDMSPSDLALPPPEVLGPVAERFGIQVVGPPLRVG